MSIIYRLALLTFVIVAGFGDASAANHQFRVASSRSEIVIVKFRGAVDVGSFDCEYVSRSSFIQRVCYDQTHAYMIIQLNGTYYHYCGIDRGTVQELKSAPSMGRYFNAMIKGRFDCRLIAPPVY